MATYLIPQFLDAGDKILGPLNMRQFGYALGGFFICVLIFTTVNSLAPGLGVYSVVPTLPVAGLSAYIAFGKYNGRDAEIYILKFILYMVKPRNMMYIRVPDTSDLDEQLAKLTINNIQAEWNAREAQAKQTSSNELVGFDSMTPEERARKIRELSSILDKGLYNTLDQVYQKEFALTQKQRLLKMVDPKTRYNQNSLSHNHPSAPHTLTTSVTTPQNNDDEDPNSMNFFE